MWDLVRALLLILRTEPTWVHLKSCANVKFATNRLLRRRFCSNCGATLEHEEPPVATQAYLSVTDRLPAVEITGGLRRALFVLGVEYFRHKHYSQAVDALHQASREEGENPTASDIDLYLGAALYGSGDHDDALEVYLQAIIAYPHLTDQVISLLSIFFCVELIAGHEDKVVSFIKKVRRYSQPLARDILNTLLAEEALPSALRGSDEAAHFTLAKLKREAGLGDEALSDITKALERSDLARAFTRDTLARDVPARLFKAELLEEIGRSDEAAREYLLAGRAWVSANKGDQALEPLRKAINLQASLVAARWELSEAWRQASYICAHSAARERLANARKEWETAEREDPTSSNTSWVYVLRALINTRAIDLLRSGEQWCPDQPWELMWQAIVFLERSILLTFDDSYRWYHLGVFYNYYRTQSCARDASMKALGLYPRNSEYLLQYAINLVNVE